MKPSILILGAGLMQRPAIQAAKSLGCQVVLVDGNPQALCVPEADLFVHLDLKDKEGIKELGDGVYYEVLTEGTGAVPADTNRVSVNYEGKLLNDTIFDSSYKRGEPAKFRCNQVIPGWTKALTNMPVGSSWMVYIPQEQAYGSENRGEKLPPFSCLIFKIDLLGIE